MKGERKLVTDYAELRSGMPVIVACDRCGREHNLLLLALTTDWKGRECFAADPDRPCGGSTCLLVGPISIASRLVYRIVDPDLEDPTTYAADLGRVEKIAAEFANYVPFSRRQRQKRERAS